MVYSVKNEYAIANKVLISVFNNQESLSEVVIISNSDEDTAIQLEKNILQKITSNYGVKSSFFAGRPPKHIALYSWCHSMPDIEYFVTSDADSYYTQSQLKVDKINKTTRTFYLYRYVSLWSRCKSWYGFGYTRQM